MAHAAFKAKYVDITAVPSVGTAPAGILRIWSNSNDSNSFYATDEAGSDIQITTPDGTLATGNAQYVWDWFTSGAGVTIPDYAAVRIISGGVNDGKIALCDNDVASDDTFLGIVYGGSIAPGNEGKVIYGGKVPGAVAGLGLPSNTPIYMSSNPGHFTATPPNFNFSTIFVIGFTRGDDLYLRPEITSELA